MTRYGQFLAAIALLIGMNFYWSKQGEAEGLFAVRDGVVSLAQHNFKNTPSAIINGNWRILPTSRNRQEQLPGKLFVNPNHAFHSEWWQWDLPDQVQFRRLSLTFDLSSEHDDLNLIIPANPSIRAIRVLEDASKEALFQQSFEDGLVEQLSLPLGSEQRFQVVMIADLKSYRNSLQAYYLSVQRNTMEDFENSNSISNGLHLGVLVILSIYFLIIMRISDFRSLAVYGIFACLSATILFALNLYLTLPEKKAFDLNYSWIIRSQTFFHVLLLLLFHRFHNLKNFGLPKKFVPTKYLSALILTLPLLPFGAFTFVAQNLTLVLVLTSLAMRAMRPELRWRSSLAIVIPLSAMPVGAIAEWREIAYAETWHVSMVHGILLSLAWQSIQSLLQLIAAFQYRQRKYALQTSYLRHLFSLVRKDISRAMLIQPADYLQQGYETTVIQRKLVEWRLQLAKIAGTMEKAEASLHRDPIHPGQVYQRIAAQDLFDDSVQTIQDMIRGFQHSHLKATHNWQEKVPKIFTDRVLINYVIFELLSKLLLTLDQQWHTLLDLNFHVEEEHHLFFISVKIQQDPDSHQLAHLHIPVWQINRISAEENFHGCLDFCQRILSNISGRIHFKRPNVNQRQLEIEIPIVETIPITQAQPGQQMEYRDVLQQLITQRSPISKIYQTIAHSDESVLHVAIFSESASIYPLLHSCLQQAKMDLLWLSNLEQLRQIKKDKKISLIIVYYEEDVETAEKILLHLPQNTGDLASAIVVLTSDRKHEHHLRLYPLQIDDLILLPVSPEELVLRLRGIILRQTTIRMAHEYNEQKTLSEDFHQIFLAEKEQIPGMQVEGLYLAADVTGGDWFQTFYDKRHHRFYAIVGDVAGRGRRSALIASAADAAFRALTQSMAKRMQALPLDRCLWDLIEGINLAIYEAAQRCQRTMTVTFIAIDLNTGDALYSNAGHGPIYIVNDHECDSMLIGGRPLGLTRELRLNYRRFHLSPDAAIFISTDGLLRNQGPNGESLNQRQLIQLLSKTAKNQNSKIGEQVLQEVKSIWQDGAMVDDVVVLVIYWKHATNPMYLHDDESA
ncbi:MAG: PP2C family protein-serine/threonine phosphatase [Oligoflexus sp.]